MFIVPVIYWRYTSHIHDYLAMFCKPKPRYVKTRSKQITAALLYSRSLKIPLKDVQHMCYCPLPLSACVLRLWPINLWLNVYIFRVQTQNFNQIWVIKSSLSFVDIHVEAAVTFELVKSFFFYQKAFYVVSKIDRSRSKKRLREICTSNNEGFNYGS